MRSTELTSPTDEGLRVQEPPIDETAMVQGSVIFNRAQEEPVVTIVSPIHSSGSTLPDQIEPKISGLEEESRRTATSLWPRIADEIIAKVTPFNIQGLLPEKRSLFFDTMPNPYLPPRVKELLNKQSLTERQKVELMSSLAEETIMHFRPKNGTFLAIDLNGCILEATNNKIDLLKKIQMIPASKPVFIWQVGKQSFSGWY